MVFKLKDANHFKQTDRERVSRGAFTYQNALKTFQLKGLTKM